MVGMQAAMSLAFSISGPFLPLFIIQLGVKPMSTVELWAGAISSVNFLLSAVLSPLWGGLADRIGRKAMVLRSSAAVSLFTALMGLSQNVGELFAFRALMGLFSGFSAAAIALVGTQVPEGRLGFSLGWMASGQLVGGLIGPLVGGLLADRLHDYRSVFFWTSAMAGLAALACGLLVTERFERRSYELTRRATVWQQLGEVARHPSLLPMFVVVLLGQFAAFGAQPIVALFLRDMMGPSAWLATAAGAAFAVMGLADLMASPWLGKRSDVIGYRRVLLVSLVGATLFTVPQAFVHSVWTFLALRFGVGLFLGGIIPTANALIGRLFAQEKRGQVYGISSSAMFLGMFLGPLSGGLIAAHFGFGAVFLTIAACLAANAVWVFVAVREPAKAGEGPT
jgi:DHA1 family multidrug resistance protein-like MFS transporter